MASSDIVQYRSPLRTRRRGAAAVFLAVYLSGRCCRSSSCSCSSFKDLLEAFKLPAVGDWAASTLFFDFTPDLQALSQPVRRPELHHLLRQQPRSPRGGSALISVVLGSMCAYALSRIEFRGKNDLFFWIISTRMAPVVAVMVPLYAIFRSAGLVGTLPGLILAYTTFNLPFAIWILKGFFDNVPYAIEEAQMCDGCHPLPGLPRDPAAGGAGHRRLPGPVHPVRLERLPVRLDHRLWRRQDAAGRDQASWSSRRTSSGAASWRRAS